MMIYPKGKYVRIDFKTLDASTPIPLTLFDEDNSAVVLAPHERLVISQITTVVTTGVNTATIFDDANDDGVVDPGERLIILGEQSTDMTFTYGVSCGLGRAPKVSASAGIITICGVGFILEDRAHTLGGKQNWREADQGQ